MSGSLTFELGKASRECALPSANLCLQSPINWKLEDILGIEYAPIKDALPAFMPAKQTASFAQPKKKRRFLLAAFFAS